MGSTRRFAPRIFRLISAQLAPLALTFLLTPSHQAREHKEVFPAEWTVIRTYPDEWKISAPDGRQFSRRNEARKYEAVNYGVPR